MTTLRALIVSAAVALLPAAVLHAVVAVTLTPSTVDAARPEQVTVAAANGADSAQLASVDHATIDGGRVAMQKSASGALTLMPPPGDAGTKVLRLFDSSESLVGEARLEYRGSQPPATGNTRAEIVARSTWYYALVTLLFAATVLPFTAAIVASVWRGPVAQRATAAPLGLPVGTVRAVLAFCLVVYLGFYVLASALSLSEFKAPDFLTGVVATVIGFYFGSRSDGAATAELAGERGTINGGGDGRDTGNGPGIVKTGAIEGTVQRADTARVARAVVTLTRAATPAMPINMVEADADGHFRFEAVEAGDYLLVAGSDGATTAPVNIRVAADETLAVTLRFA